MEFKIGAEVLSSYVNIVSRVVNAKANLPLLNNILIDVSKDTILLSGTDLEVQITAAAQLNTKEAGKTSVNARMFAQYVNTIPKSETLTISQEKGLLKVSSGVGSAEFATREVEDFPLFEDTEMLQLFEIPAESFATMVDKTIVACAKNDIRPILTGVNVEIDGDSVTFVALDTFRLSKISTTSQSKYVGKKQVAIPAAAMENMVRIVRDSFISSLADSPIVSCKLASSGNFVLLQYGEVKLYARLIEGEYPEYKAVIPVAHQMEATVNRVAWLESLKRVGVFAQSAINQKVILSFDSGKIVMESQVPEIGNIREELEATIDGATLRVAFQIKYLTDILTLVSDEAVIFRASITGTAPQEFIKGSFLEPSQETFLHILMPLKLDE